MLLKSLALALLLLPASWERNRRFLLSLPTNLEGSLVLKDLLKKLCAKHGKGIVLKFIMKYGFDSWVVAQKLQQQKQTEYAEKQFTNKDKYLSVPTRDSCPKLNRTTTISLTLRF
jgi:hypothetical protein